MEDWEKRMPPSERFVDVQAVVQAVDHLIASGNGEATRATLTALTSRYG